METINNEIDEEIDEDTDPCENRYDTPMEQLESIIKLSAEDRHSHCLAQIAESRTAWGIYHEDDCLIDTKWPQLPLFHIWPAWEYAEMWLSARSDELPDGCFFRCISLQELVLELLPMFASDHVQLGSFFLPYTHGIVISPEEWKESIGDQQHVDWRDWHAVYDGDIPEH